MALTTKDNVLLIAPELSIASNDLWDMVFADVGNAISTSVFGAKTERAARYWVAHNMTLLADSSLAGSSGPITKEKVGDVMREYAKIVSVSESEKDYSRTGYGQTFLSIRKACIPLFKVVPPGV